MKSKTVPQKMGISFLRRGRTSQNVERVALRPGMKRKSGERPVNTFRRWWAYPFRRLLPSVAEGRSGRERNATQDLSETSLPQRNELLLHGYGGIRVRQGI